jgi:hypothetical protein
VVRGGSWNNNPQNLRSANRNRNRTDEANNNQGFRIASSPTHLPEPDGSRVFRVCRGRPVAELPGCAGGAGKDKARDGGRLPRRHHAARLPPFQMAVDPIANTGEIRGHWLDAGGCRVLAGRGPGSGGRTPRRDAACGQFSQRAGFGKWLHVSRIRTTRGPAFNSPQSGSRTFGRVYSSRRKPGTYDGGHQAGPIYHGVARCRSGPISR